MEYNEYTRITRIKLLLLKYGVYFEPMDLFNQLPDIDKYKTKHLKSKIISENNKVYNCEKENYIIPSEILISKDEEKSISKLRYEKNSPVTLKIKDNKIYLEYENIVQDVCIELVKKNELLSKKIPKDVLDNESTIGDYIQLIGLDRIGILFFEGCYNWMIGKPCKFCNLPHSDEYHRFIPNLNNLKNENNNYVQWWNKYKKDYLIGLEYSLKEFLNECNLEHCHIAFMAGNLISNVEMWNMAEEVLNYLKDSIEFAKYDCYLNIAPHDDIKRLEFVKKIGIKQVQYNLEVVNEETFKDACPNKMDFNEFIAKLKEAVIVLGNGNVRSNFVLGLNTLSETIDFANYMAKEGIVFDYTVFQPKRGTLYENKKSPDFDDVIKFTAELARIYKRFRFKPIFCELSSRSCVINEFYKEMKK